MHDLRTGTLKQQYNLVKFRTLNHNTYNLASHVMQYGDVELYKEQVFLYIGTNLANDNFRFTNNNALPSFSKAVNQRDADLVYFWNKFQRAPQGSSRKLDAERELLDVMAHRNHIDKSIELTGKLLFGAEKGSEVLKFVRSAGLPLVDDWSCLNLTACSLIQMRAFETHCGSLSQYGMKHMRSIANICNAGIKKAMMAEVSKQACDEIPLGQFSSLNRGFSA